MRTRFCEAILREEGFAKPRLSFLKFGGIRVHAPQEGAGRMRGGSFGFLASRLLEKGLTNCLEYAILKVGNSLINHQFKDPMKRHGKLSSKGLVKNMSKVNIKWGKIKVIPATKRKEVVVYTGGNKDNEIAVGSKVAFEMENGYGTVTGILIFKKGKFKIKTENSELLIRGIDENADVYPATIRKV